MQESLKLRRGRGRGIKRGDQSLLHNQPRIPAIPPFPFHLQHITHTGITPSILHNSVPRGQAPCNPVARNLFNRAPRGLRFDYRCSNVGNGPRFPVPIRESVRGPVQCQFIPSLPKPHPNVLTQEEWDELNHNGRPDHGSVCAVVCCCTFGQGDSFQKIFSFFCSGESSSEHSEKKALQQVIMYENGCGRDIRKVVLISSRSPCMSCAQDMITFVKSRRFLMNLYFTALEEKIDPNSNGISILASYGIPMRVADSYIWSYLTKLLPVCDGKPRTTFSDGSEVNEINRKTWDKVWCQQLEAVIHQDLPNLLNSGNLINKFNDERRMLMPGAQNIS